MLLYINDALWVMQCEGCLENAVAGEDARLMADSWLVCAGWPARRRAEEDGGGGRELLVARCCVYSARPADEQAAFVIAHATLI